MVSTGKSIAPSFSFLQQLEEKSGQPVSRCYQCKKCTGGCPMSFAMDIHPNQVVRFAQLGIKDKLLASRAIWVCACCKTCADRCPNGIDISAVNDALKAMAAEEKVAAGDKMIPVFHESFLSSVQRNGRLYEAGMLIGYKLKTKNYTQDMQLGMQFFKKGKLKLLPEKISRIREIKQIFEKAKEKSL